MTDNQKVAGVIVGLAAAAGAAALLGTSGGDETGRLDGGTGLSVDAGEGLPVPGMPADAGDEMCTGTVLHVPDGRRICVNFVPGAAVDAPTPAAPELSDARPHPLPGLPDGASDDACPGGFVAHVPDGRRICLGDFGAATGAPTELERVGPTRRLDVSDEARTPIPGMPPDAGDETCPARRVVHVPDGRRICLGRLGAADDGGRR